jgi:predicted transcriptional regulator of viral defense system
MIDAFKENKGYMSFKELQKKGVTVLQIREMEEAGVLEKFARGWYWCNDCGFAKPADHKYVEIAKVNPKAVICMESACFLSGIIDDFDTKRFYFKRTGIKGEIVEKKTKCGSYYYYSPERTFCDCIRLQNKIDKDVFDEIMTEYKDRQGKLKRTYDYADKLRCIKNIQEADATVQS